MKGSFYFITLPHACKGAPSKGLQRVWSCPFRCIPCCMHDAFNTFATLSVSVHVNSCHVTTLMFLQLLRGPPFHRSRCQDCHCHRLDGKLLGAWPLAQKEYQKGSKLFQEMQAFPKCTSHFSNLSTNHKDIKLSKSRNQGTALDGWNIGNLYIKLQCFHGALCSQCKANLSSLGLDETSMRLGDPCLPSSAATTHATRAEVLGIPVSSVNSCHQLAGLTLDPVA